MRTKSIESLRNWSHGIRSESIECLQNLIDHVELNLKVHNELETVSIKWN